MNKPKNQQPSNPTYFLVAGKEQLEFKSNSHVTSLERDGTTPASMPRFLSGSIGSPVRHMVACIGCDFVEKPTEPINDAYALSLSPKGGVLFRKIKKAERDTKSNNTIHYLKVTQTGKVFAVLQG